MPMKPQPHLQLNKSLRGAVPLRDRPPVFDAKLAGQAIVEGLEYLKIRLNWSGTKVAKLLHLPANTLNMWIKNGTVPIHHAALQPDVQAIIHLLAIHRSLEAMFENPEHQSAWLATFHPELNDVPEHMM